MEETQNHFTITPEFSTATVAEAVEPTKISAIWPRMAQNISEDYLEFFIITSQAAGLEDSDLRPFGVGKSTFAIHLAYFCWAYKLGLIKFARHNKTGQTVILDVASPREKFDLYKQIVEKYVKWHIDDVLRVLFTAESPLPAVVWDDVQKSAPAYQHIPKSLREKIEALTMARQLVKNLIMTAPSVGSVAKPLKREVSVEIIIPRRGTYEIQFFVRKRDFDNPTFDNATLVYECTGEFAPLPPAIQDLYYKKRLESWSVLNSLLSSVDSPSKT